MSPRAGAGIWGRCATATHTFLAFEEGRDFPKTLQKEPQDLNDDFSLRTMKAGGGSGLQENLGALSWMRFPPRGWERGSLKGLADTISTCSHLHLSLTDCPEVDVEVKDEDVAVG